MIGNCTKRRRPVVKILRRLSIAAPWPKAHPPDANKLQGVGPHAKQQAIHTQTTQLASITSLEIHTQCHNYLQKVNSLRARDVRGVHAARAAQPDITLLAAEEAEEMERLRLRSAASTSAVTLRPGRSRGADAAAAAAFLS